MLLASLTAFFQQQGTEPTYWVAYSGGMDSQVLLHLCQQIRDHLPIKVKAIHINHDLSPNAQAWVTHCQQMCADYKIDLSVQKIPELTLAGDSLEAVVREQRYGFIAALMQPGDIVLTAHHQDDQAETLLLQLLRGAGVKGLAAMPMLKSFGVGQLARPLLNYSHAGLEAYAQQHALKWIQDESNFNTQFTRNFLRHDIMPTLRQHWPSASATIARSAAQCAEAQVLLTEFAAALIQQVRGSQLQTLSVTCLRKLTLAQQRLILRHWLQELGLPLPDSRKLATIQTNVLQAANDSKASVEWGEVRLRRYRDDLHIVAITPVIDSTQTYRFEPTDRLLIPNIGSLHGCETKGAGLRPDIFPLTVRFRQGGELAFIPNCGHKKLKNLFQEWQVLPWLRDLIPLMYAGDKLVCVPGYYLHSDYQAKQHEMGCVIEFT